MSKIDKMAIQGIRSFGPEERDMQVISFLTPLTLILGPNGTGKTTIIECLKYMTTGEMPPGAKTGGAFIYDPKIARESEVKGQVRLLLRDVAGQIVCATRSMVVTQKNKTTTMRTLEGVITRKNANGEKQSLSSKCADMDREMVACLGVSKAVLENVIFCHQEESNWPLAEAKSVKMRFDDIFASTRYVKALDKIKKLRKEQSTDIKANQINLMHLKTNKERATGLKRDYDDVMARNEAANDSLKNIHIQIAPLQGQLEDIEHRSRDIYKLQSQIDKCESERKEMERTRESMEAKIGLEFEGSLDELKHELVDFHKKMADQKETLRKNETKMETLGADVMKLNRKRTEQLTEQGKLQHEAEVFNDNVEKRSKLVRTYANHYNFPGFEQLDERAADRFMESLRARKDVFLQDARRVRTEFETREAGVQTQIDDVRDSKTKLEQTQLMKTNQIAEYRADIRKLTAELQRVEASAGNLDVVQRDLALKSHELADAEAEVDLDQLKVEVKTLQTDRTELDRKVKDLDAELNRLHQESSVRTQLDIHRKEKANKEEQIKRIKNRHEETFLHLFSEIPTSGFRTQMDDYLQSLSGNIQQESSKCQRAKVRLSELETRCKMTREQLKSREDELKEYDEQLYELCGSQDFDEGLASLQEKMQKLQDEKGPLSGTRYMFEKYIGQLKKTDPVCPLCRREFDEQAEIDELIQDMQRNVSIIPSKVEEKERELKLCYEKYDTMVQMKPRLSARGNLAEKEIPDLRETVRTLSAEIEKLRVEISTVEDSIKLMQSDEMLARNIQPDLVMVDKYMGELRMLEKDIAKQEAKLSSGGSDRSLEAVRMEKEEKQMELDRLSQQLEYKREKIGRQTERIQDLRATVNELTAEKLQIENDLQKRIKLEESKSSLTEQCLSLQNDVEDAKEQARPLEAKIEALRSQRAVLIRERDTAMEEAKQLMEKLKEHGSSVVQVQKEISRYMNEAGPDKLSSCQERLLELDQSQARYKQMQDDVTRTIDEIKDNLANQLVRERVLDDNLKLREKREEIVALTRTTAELKRKLGDFDVQNLDRQKRELQTKLENLNKEKHTVEGRQRGLKDEVARLRRDLNEESHKDADKKYQEELINVKTMEIANKDLEKYSQALDWAVMRYHQLKMKEINDIIRELWRNTYRGNDIDTIEIRSDEEDGSAAAGAGVNRARRTYHYRVVMVKGEAAIDMRGRCSAGQKVLASLVIRLALAETFCHKCGILALDEPTTNLDRDNIESLAYALCEIIKARHAQKNFQLVVITHDEDFVELLGSSDYVDYFYRIGRTFDGKSVVKQEKIGAVRK